MQKIKVDKSTIDDVKRRIKAEQNRKFKKKHPKMKTTDIMSKGMKSLLAQAKARQAKKND